MWRPWNMRVGWAAEARAPLAGRAAAAPAPRGAAWPASACPARRRRRAARLTRSAPRRWLSTPLNPSYNLPSDAWANVRCDYQRNEARPRPACWRLLCTVWHRELTRALLRRAPVTVPRLLWPR
jgi:hypothetical protein